MSDPLGIATYEQFVELDRRSEERRYEFFDGVVVAMAEPSRRHEAIVSNLSLLLGPAVRASGCSFFTRGSIYAARMNSEVKPDWIVLCDPRDLGGSGAELTRSRYRFPRMVVEVLSPSNRMSEMAEKLRIHASVSSLEFYLLIDSMQRRVWRYERSSGLLVDRTRHGEPIVTPFGTVDVEALYDDTGVPELRDISFLMETLPQG